MKLRKYHLLKKIAPTAFWQLLRVWPKDSPLLAFGGKGSGRHYLALSFQEVEPDRVFSYGYDSISNSQDKLLSCPQYFGLLPYDNSGAERPRVFKVGRLLLFDEQGQKVYLVTHDDQHAYPYNVSLDELLMKLGSASLAKLAPPSSHRWKCQISDHDYLKLAESCLLDIRQGRYYQINLLRYFLLLESKVDWQRQFYYHGGPFGIWIKIPDLELISFSPERFFEVKGDNRAFRIRTNPIKGTMPVFDDPIKNKLSKEQLLSSEKDQAELHMIVDLMRNDLMKVCQTHSVDVLDPGSLHSFSNVHHLIALIEGRLNSSLTLGEIFETLCPGGSITGAPKVEVMKAIKEKEGRSRGYFMGNGFLFDPLTGYLDSSILIRTLVAKGGIVEFAAGSGIVINSSPKKELEEIKAKGQVVGLDY